MTEGKLRHIVCPVEGDKPIRVSVVVTDDTWAAWKAEARTAKLPVGVYLVTKAIADARRDGRL